MTKRTFRLLILLHWSLVFVAVVIAVVTKKSLPTELVAYMDAQAKIPTSFSHEVLWLIYAIVTVAAWIGLLLFKNRARHLVLFCYVAGLVFLSTRAAYVRSGLIEVMLNVITTLGGVIFALMYFSPMKEAFKSQGEV
jgi:hypothetical protein